MNSNNTAKILQNLVAKILDRNGYSYVVGNNMTQWREMRIAKGARIPSQFNPEFCDQTQCRYVSILDREGNIAATRAWRTIEIDDFVEMIEGGRMWVDDPESYGWRRFDSGLNRGAVISESGWISVGGAMQSFVPGKRLSWYLGSLHWIFATMEGVDCTITTAFRDIAAAQIPS